MSVQSLKRPTSSIKSSGPRKKAKADDGGGWIKDGLCRRCDNIKWQQIRNMNRNGIAVTHLPESHKQLEESFCRVCSLLANLKPATLDSEECTLRLYPLRSLFPGSLLLTTNTTPQPALKCCVLGVSGSKSLPAPKNEGLSYLGMLGEEDMSESRDYGPQRTTSLAGFDWIKKCVQHCRRLSGGSHRTCSSPNEYPGGDFRLIELSTMTIVNARNLKGPYVPYATLSYVWGEHGGPDWREGIPRSELRKVVGGSIEAAERLGYSYIWIDRYVCAGFLAMLRSLHMK